MRSYKRMCCLLVCAVLVLKVNPPLIAQTDATTELTVFAAASLTEAFQSLGSTFETTHRRVKIRFNFGGSQQLVQQLVLGAKADLFASASMKQMNIAVKSGVIDTTVIGVVARNKLVVIVPKKNPAHLSVLKDLARPGIKIVLADSSVPVGQYAVQVLERCSTRGEFGTSFRHSVLGNVVSYEENVRAVLSKVRLGECDAGIVYSSDIVHDSSHEVRRIEIPDTLNSIAEYPMAIVRGTKTHQTAREFLDYVLSSDGVRVLSEFGFMDVSQREKR